MSESKGEDSEYSSLLPGLYFDQHLEKIQIISRLIIMLSKPDSEKRKTLTLTNNAHLAPGHDCVVYKCIRN